jgi:hypothetical protein
MCKLPPDQDVGEDEMTIGFEGAMTAKELILRLSELDPSTVIYGISVNEFGENYYEGWAVGGIADDGCIEEGRYIKLDLNE